MVMKVGNGFGIGQFWPRCNVSCGFACTKQSQLTSFNITATSSVFQRCGTHDEDVLHCLKDCAPSEEVWQLIYSVSYPYFFNLTSLNTWLQTMSKRPFGNMLAITIWWI